MIIRMTPITQAIRTIWPRPRPMSALDHARVEAGKLLTEARIRLEESRRADAVAAAAGS